MDRVDSLYEASHKFAEARDKLETIKVILDEIPGCEHDLVESYYKDLKENVYETINRLIKHCDFIYNKLHEYGDYRLTASIIEERSRGCRYKD